ncbi:MAG: porin [Rhizobiales bacterium]|nr:porin [Hyphomicrobiales bacterium]
MRLTALLMASAAALVPSSLSAGELVLGVDPIDYVRVCDAFGSGYMYLPGSQTCLSVGAYLQFDAWFYDSRESQHFFNVADYLTGAVAPGTDPSNPLAERSGVVAGYLYDTDDYAAAWTMSEEIKVTTIAQTQTDIGVVATYARLVVYNGIDPTNSNDAAALSRAVTLDRAYAAIGPVFVGYYDSIFAYQAAALSLDANINADPQVDQFQLRHTVGPWGVAFALEDPRDWFTGASNITGDYPSLAAAFTGTWKSAYFQAAFGATDRTTGTGWGAQLSGSLGSGTQPQMQVNLAYSENAPVYVGGTNCTGACANEGAWWSAMLSGQVNVSKTLSLNATSSYLDGPGTYQWQAAGGIGWAPTGTALLSAELLYIDDAGSDSLSLHTQLKTSFGNY